VTDPIRVVLADDHPLLRLGLRQVIEAEPDLRVIGEAADGRAAFDLVLREQPDVTVLDVQMPALSGFEVAGRLRAAGARTAVVFLTMHREPAMLDRAMEQGAAGYVLKDSALSEIVQAMRWAVAGRIFVSPALSAHLVGRAYGTRRTPAPAGGPLDRLTERERQILRLIAEARTSKEIADVLGVHYRTVENHRTAISQKLGLQGSHALVKFAFEHKAEL
jgi:DNA-binding NarL/FixJ family response regulator